MTRIVVNLIVTKTKQYKRYRKTIPKGRDYNGKGRRDINTQQWSNLTGVLIKT